MAARPVDPFGARREAFDFMNYVVDADAITVSSP